MLRKKKAKADPEEEEQEEEEAEEEVEQEESESIKKATPIKTVTRSEIEDMIEGHSLRISQLIQLARSAPA